MRKSSVAMRSHFGSLLPIVGAMLLAFCLTYPAQGQATTASSRKIDLRILYAGHPGSEREADFLAFLGQNFRQVKAMDLAAVTGKEDDFDVVVFDHDGDYFSDSKIKAPQVRLPQGYSRPTLTVGVPGAMICGQMRLKTRYL